MINNYLCLGRGQGKTILMYEHIERAVKSMSNEDLKKSLINYKRLCFSKSFENEHFNTIYIILLNEHRKRGNKNVL